MKILVTGGLGFIGSHTCVELLNSDYEVVIIDNLSNSSIDVLDKIEKITSKRPKFYEYDVCNKEKVSSSFSLRFIEPESLCSITVSCGLIDSLKLTSTLFK